jgi:TonB-dependent receptor
MVFISEAASARQQAGSIRGVVYDKEFDVPLQGAQVQLVETRQSVLTTDQGNYVFSAVAAGKYTLVFSKDGYVRQVKGNVLVASGQLTEIDVNLSGEFTEMEEFVVQDILDLGGATEAGLLRLRLDSPAFMDSIGAELMSRAGASDAAGALRLVAGASVQDGKFAVIRGLPDRYVSSQMNGVRLPSADQDKRAVELDQFPAAIIESVRVSKTFTPDQQGDASGGAVDVRLKGIPDQGVFSLKAELSTNSQVRGRDDFLTYKGGGVSYWGRDDGGRDIQFDHLGQNWDGAVGVSRADAPTDYKWSLTAGGKHDVGEGIKIGGLANFFYERDSQFWDNGVNDSWWVTHPGQGLVPQTFQGVPEQHNFKTGLFDVTRGEQSVRWGGLGTLGIETERNKVGLTYLYTRTAADVATLAEDTRGKHYFFPGYDPDNPMGIGNDSTSLNDAPYIRTETLEYTERTTDTLQLSGEHTLPWGAGESESSFHFLDPELTWTLARSSADLDQPDKRLFTAFWLPASFHPATPFLPEGTTDPTWYPYPPAANFTLGNLQRVWKTIEEDSDQYSINLKWPFQQWTGDKGYVKVGVFDDVVHRKFKQETFSNFSQPGITFPGGFDDFWTATFPGENHPITAANLDDDYKGRQEVSAWYSMADVPLNSSVSVIGGARFESTEIGIVNMPEPEAQWFPPGVPAAVALHPGDADVDFKQHDVLPAVGVVYRPVDNVSVRASYSETVARQTFKELTPIIQQEFAGGPVFIGNPDLVMSALKNYDLRVDHTPYDGGLISLSWFKKDVTDPIEYVQVVEPINYTTARNYPKGELSGYEIELRQDLGRWTESLQGLALGANATFIDSEVTLPADEAADLAAPGIEVPTTSRDMTNAPSHLYNIYATYDLVDSGTQVGLFYTLQGDTLVAGAGQANGNFVPDIYAKEYDTLNFSLAQQIGPWLRCQFQAKNLTNAKIETVYRSDVIGSDKTHTSYTKGIDYSFSLTANFSF